MIYKDESPCASPTLGSGSGKKHKRQIVDLPPEILEKVYLHLSLSDRLRLSRVSHLWGLALIHRHAGQYTRSGKSPRRCSTILHWRLVGISMSLGIIEGIQ